MGQEWPLIVFYAFDLLQLNARIFEIYRLKSGR
jgi:hypothetical protein